MKISRQEVEHIAGLARLDLTPAELDLYADHMNQILSYMDKLSELNTAGLPLTNHATGTTNAFREDIVRPSLPREEAIKNAPASDGQAFIVPRVI